MGDGGAGRREADRNRVIVQDQQRSFQEAQDLLGKARDEAITDIEAAEARAAGLIDDAQEAVITQLNQTEAGAIQTLRDLDERTQSDLDEAESNVLNSIFSTGVLTSDIARGLSLSPEQLEAEQGNVLQDLVETGIVDAQSLTGTFLQSLRDISGFSERALEALAPFQEQGERSLLQQRVLSGTATEAERQDFEERFGAPEFSPLAQLRIEEEERATARQQQALGRRFSGLGQEEIRERGVRRIGAEESARQLQSAQFGTQLGQGAAAQRAGILQQTGQAIGGLRFGLGERLLQNRIRQSELAAQAQQQFGFQRAGLGQQFGQNLANVQLGLGQRRADVLGQLGQARFNLPLQTGQAVANLRTGGAANIANLIASGAIQSAQQLQAASRFQSGSEGSFLSDIGGLLGAGANFLTGGGAGALGGLFGGGGGAAPAAGQAPPLTLTGSGGGFVAPTREDEFAAGQNPGGTGVINF